MQAIVVKYKGPTNTKGSKLIAKCDAGSLSVSYPYGLNQCDVMRFAAVALCDKLGWSSANLVEGSLPGNAGSVFVFIPK